MMTLKLDKRGRFTLETEDGVSKLTQKQVQQQFKPAMIAKMRSWLNITQSDVVTVELD